MPPDSGGIFIGADLRNHQFAPGLPPGWGGYLLGDGEVGVGDVDDRVGHGRRRLLEPPRGRQVQHLPLERHRRQDPAREGKFVSTAAESECCGVEKYVGWESGG